MPLWPPRGGESAWEILLLVQLSGPREVQPALEPAAAPHRSRECLLQLYTAGPERPTTNHDAAGGHRKLRVSRRDASSRAAPACFPLSPCASLLGGLGAQLSK